MTRVMAYRCLRGEALPLISICPCARPSHDSTDVPLAGTAAAGYLLVNSSWSSPVPEGLTLVRSPTRMVWILGRTQTNGDADYALVHGMQNEHTLVSLTDYLSGKIPDIPSEPTSAELKARYDAMPADQRLKPPAQHMVEQPTADFYAHLLRLLGDNPPASADAPMIATMASFGLVAADASHPPLAWYHLPFLVAGRWCADQLVSLAATRPRTVHEGWALPPASLGSYGTDYVTRAVVATVALGANLPEDAVYPNARTDLTGDRLHGDKCYRLTFVRDNHPPVRAFWSMTAYGDNDYLIDNVLNRYAVGDRGGALHVDANGTTDIWCAVHNTRF